MRVRFLSRLGRNAPGGGGGGPTTITLTATWSTDVKDSGQEFPNDGSDWCGGGGDGATYRVAQLFDITTLPAAGVTVTLVELIVEILAVANAGALLWDIDGYNGDGLLNPETDTQEETYARCGITGVYVNDTTEFRTTGLKSAIDLGATAISDVTAARAAGVIYSVAIRETTDTTGNNKTEFAEYTHGTNPPKLRITYTTP